MSILNYRYSRELIDHAKQDPRLYFNFFKEIVKNTKNPLFYPKNTGDSFVVLCPLHKERTPSMRITYVNKEKGFRKPFWMFKCFGCGKAGDIFTLIMLTSSNRLSFIEVLNELYIGNSIYYEPHHNPNQLTFDFGREFYHLYSANIK